ncbi:DUF4259 domain-containing protein [Actinomadura roseirufa]|uniref:DUF4259 domain-containing protein n=1 Tax=Actinomadura roseirufa TaxID=2094049 RepID=UPI001041425B|nr:DUF4259 domain-containing protein [Actinomadura roseirufa]
MGTWDTGPFDNDTAADFSGQLDALDEDERPAAIRGAFQDVLAETDYLDYYEATIAVAAAALVAAQCPGGKPTDEVYGPDGSIPPLSTDLRPLAVRALDRITAEDSELHELWEETGAEGWLAEIEALRTILSA